ncbi:amino acid adenylation domain-containing protein [Actinocorallia sp. API 0066]|uniref:amino acid adenylation domain-containing protein n=1 Tax=Actinocorallia sp. API 0066 TaxID=2896846 RepID=UPI001E363D6D|nr:amino acid adenylation domain-containing protein [Actinocorallia sp. API 0066]MCD0447747.1 amino acid adenylation domain-containing protein [Actinocorallia sp. API 0066]
MRVVVVDAFDSFVHTLCHYLSSAGAEPVVVRSDVAEPGLVGSLRPDALLLGPGPGHPAEAGYVPLIREFAGRLPVLGVCLGHQAVGLAFGGEVVPATHLVHGKSSRISHDGTGLLAGLDADFRATRYHSLIVPDKTVPAELQITARSRDDGYVMGLRHRALPVESVQFHPESIGTENGYLMIKNFVARAADARAAAPPGRAAVAFADLPVPDGHAHELIGRIARERPDAVAVLDQGVPTTFGALDADADRLAAHLAGLGAGPGAKVGVLLERSAASVVAQLAVFKAGAAVVLLDPRYPAERLAFMVADSAATAVVTTSGLAPLLPDGVPLVPAEPDAGWRGRAPVDPRGEITDESVSHIAYTSGSTGKPKAVALRHGPFRNTVHALRAQCGIGPDARGTWLCSPGAGLVEVDFFPVLAAGGCVVIPDEETAASPELLRDWLVAERVTHTLQMTAMAERLWTLEWPEGTALRSMRIAGERVRSWPPARLPFTVLNVYGSSEANVVATCDLTATAAGLSDAERARRRPPIGGPVPNVRTYILDDELRPVPPGEIGELHVSGRSLSLGYLNRPDENAARFLPNPLPDDPYPVLYRTGDLARHTPEGLIEVVGRADSETKIRGYRVHLGEIESVLAGQDGVRQCAVLAREDREGEPRLVAYVEPDPARPARVPDLRAALARVLPPYMLPAAYVVLALPTTANGKIDRAALPAPSAGRPELEVPYRAPQTPSERALVRIWEDVLEVEGVGLDDDFHHLGGDSLRATRLLAAVRARFPGEIGMPDLFARPTVAGLAALLAADPARPSGDPALRHAPFPLTAAQREMWAASGFQQPARDVYEWPLDWVDEHRLAAAWRAVVARHDALRTAVHPDGTQAVAPEGAHFTLRDLRDADAEAAARELAAIRAASRSGARPHRFTLSLLPDGGAHVQLAVQPLVIDPESMHHVVLPDLAAYYEDPDTLRPPPSFTFREHVASSRPEPSPRTSRGPEPGHYNGLTHLTADLDLPSFTRLRAAAGPRLPEHLAAALHTAAPRATILLRRSSRPPHLADVTGNFAHITELFRGGPETLLLTLQTTPADAPTAPSAVISTSPYATLDIRAVLDPDHLRLHLTTNNNPPQAQTLATSFLTHLRDL